MALYCEEHHPWDNYALATIPVSCPDCIIESLRAEIKDLKYDLECAREVAGSRKARAEAAEADASVMAEYLNDRREMRWDDELLNAIDKARAAGEETE
jgi:hypothetical protein